MPPVSNLARLIEPNEPISGLLFVRARHRLLAEKKEEILEGYFLKALLLQNY